MNGSGQTFRELYESTPVSERPPCQLWWEKPLPAARPLRTALAEPETEEERRVMTTRRQSCTAPAQPVQKNDDRAERSETDSAGCPQGGAAAASTAMSDDGSKPGTEKPVNEQTAPPRKRFLVSLVKMKIDYFLEYELQPDKAWKLIDWPAQLAALQGIPVAEHPRHYEQAGYVEWKRETRWR